jgi:putative acetyltransferase
MLIRPEQPADVPAIRTIVQAAFGRDDEADLVERLRRRDEVLHAAVAVYEDRIVGHIMFSPVRIDTAAPELVFAGLAPLAVHPDVQRQGVGAGLVRHGIEVFTARRCEAVFVLGDPAYYARFGFVPAIEFGITCMYDAPEAFQVLPLTALALPAMGGVARYASAFDALG